MNNQKKMNDRNTEMKYGRRPEGGTNLHRSAALLLFVLFGLVGCSDAPTEPSTDEPSDGNGTPDAYDHTRAPGESARDLLAGDDFDRLVVQVQYVEGFAPAPDTRQHLEDFLAARLNKPAGIEIQVDAEPLQIETKETYSTEDVRDIEEEHRTAYTEGRTLTAYFLFLDGEYDDASNVLGIAYNNTSMAIFAEKIHDNTGGPTQPSRAKVEGTVMNHEFGHILGLVDSGSPMQEEHRDQNHQHHCENENCLMYYAVRTTDFLDNLLNADPPELDENCIQDLQANGGK